MPSALSFNADQALYFEVIFSTQNTRVPALIKKMIEYIFDNKGVYKWDNLATGESV